MAWTSHANSIDPNMSQTPGKPPLTLDVLRILADWAASCAERSLPIFESESPLDLRPQEALVSTRIFAQGGPRTAHLRQVAWASLAASKETVHPAASAAARAAGLAAATAYTHPIASSHQVNHIVSPIAYSAHAIALQAGTQSAAIPEIEWAIQHVPGEVRQLVRHLPARRPGKGPLAYLCAQIEASLRSP